MTFTHKYDYIAKIPLVLMVLGFGIYFQIRFPEYQKNVGLVVTAVPGVLIYFIFLRPLSAWCYARFTLGARLTFAESRRAACLFSPILNFTSWEPLEHVASLPEDVRKAAIMEAVDEYVEPASVRSANWAKAPMYAWVLRVTCWAGFLYIFIGTSLDWWPFEDLARLQATYLFSGRFYRSLNVLLGMIPIAVPYGILEAKFGGPQPFY